MSEEGFFGGSDNFELLLLILSWVLKKKLDVS